MQDKSLSEQEKYYKQKNFNSKVKGVLLIVVIIFLVTAIMSNSGKDQPEKVNNGPMVTNTVNQDTLPPTQEEPKTEEVKVTTFKIGDTVKLHDTQLAVMEKGECKSTFQKDSNKTFFLDAIQENIGKESTSYNSFNFKLQDDKEFTYNPTFVSCKDPIFSAGNLQPTQKTRGYIHFEIPKESTPKKLIYTPNMFKDEQILIEL